MSIELWVTILIAAFGGLCFLMWNTDGSIDYVPAVLGTIIGAVALGMMVWSAALTYLMSDVSDLPAAVRVQVRAMIDGRQPSTWLIWALVALSQVLLFMPKFFSAVRTAQKK